MHHVPLQMLIGRYHHELDTRKTHRNTVTLVNQNPLNDAMEIIFRWNY